ncbi:hypothetical protein BHE90_009519 [Fusarium euwallaceae]|uniref:Heterokaryon incompatibility domain-containing protein n=1 Tax=Fusarium euwallaceae TaxID=1147111 RepID=A0A430LK14_9HYPO|nr:hypothetical protein BHE90_009519 [Fusarium euwallaceae]
MARCDFCRQLTLEKLRGRLLFHPNLASLKKSADNGCDFCFLCWEGFKFEWSESEIDSALNDKAPEGVQDFDPTIWIYGHFQDFSANLSQPQVKVACGEVSDITGVQERNDVLNWVTLAIYGEKGSRQILGRLCTADHDPDLYVAMIRIWLSRCERLHRSCDFSGTLEMPTRLIHVGNPQTGRAPRLVITAPATQERYLALSYCWGPATDTFTLNSSTIEEMLMGIDESRVVAAHRDTFALARTLGIDYVWIDALCIIQGNKEDWEHESKLMAKVYGNAYLTVIAARSSDARNSFIVNHLQQRAPPCKIPMDDSSSESAFIGEKRSRDLGPTETRGWCFQEKLLSRRTIIFAAEQLIFSCRSRSYNEDGFVGDDTSTSSLQSLLYGGDTDLSTRREKLLKQWDWVVFTYTKRQLSNPHDVFAAIASIALPISEVLGSRYLAGLWECDLVRGLLWRPGHNMGTRFGPGTRPLPTRFAPAPVVRAPSWSWAAIQGSVLYVSRDAFKRKLVKYQNEGFIKVQPKLRNPDRWSPDVHCSPSTLHMPHCELQLCGRMAEAIVLETSDSEYLKSLSKRYWYVPTMTWHGSLLGRKDAEKDTIRTDLSLFVALGAFDFAAEKVQEMWCLQLTAEEGLMLRQTQDGKFARLGWFVLDNKAWFDKIKEAEVSLV